MLPMSEAVPEFTKVRDRPEKEAQKGESGANPAGAGITRILNRRGNENETEKETVAILVVAFSDSFFAMYVHKDMGKRRRKASG